MAIVKSINKSIPLDKHKEGENPLSDSIDKSYRNIISSIGEDLNREGLRDTPKRAESAIKFLTQGYQQNINTIVNGALFTTDIDELIIVKDIELYSLCEHHILPFIGKCHIGYIPNGKILGLSKLARIVDMFAKRLQVQENLTKQIANAIKSITNAKGVGVIIEANHLCMMMRGVQKQNSTMTTSVMLGIIRENDKTRNEFLKLINKQN